MANRRLPIAALAATIALAGCGPTNFIIPPDRDEAQFHRDNFDCAAAAKGLVGDQFVMGPPLMIAAAQIGRQNDLRAAHDECMLGRGYTKAPRS